MISWTLLNLKTCEKDSSKRMRRQVKEWEQLFTRVTSDNGLLLKIYKEFLKLSNKKNEQPDYNMGKIPKQTLTK